MVSLDALPVLVSVPFLHIFLGKLRQHRPRDDDYVNSESELLCFLGLLSYKLCNM